MSFAATSLPKRAGVDALRDGARVRVAIPRNEPCHLHSLDSVPVLGAIGTVDRVDERLGEHGVVVVFELWHQGTRSMHRFRPSELVPA
jgi:hypothetical protein